MSFTYAQMVDAILAFEAEGSGDELDDNIDTMIGLGEIMLLRDLDLTIFDSLQAITFSNGNPVVPKPDNTISTLAVYQTLSSSDIPLDKKTLEYCKDYTPNPATTGTVLYWAEYDEDNYYVAPSPAATPTAGKALVNLRPDSLVVDTSGTFLSTRVPDALLHACMVSAEKFIKDDDRIATWRTEYDTRLLPAARQELQDLMRRRYQSVRGA